MARVHRVTRSNKEHTCGLGHVIPKGDPYLWAKPGFRTRTPKVRCIHHPFRPSDLATGANQEPLAAQEAFTDALDALEPHDYDGLEEARSEFESALEEYVNVRQEGLDAWENGNATMEDLLYTAQSALDEFSSFTVDEFDEEEPDTEDGEESPEWEAWDSARDEHWETVLDDARSAAESIEL